MKRILCALGTIVLLLLVCPSALAQFDLYGGPRLTVLAVPTTLTQSGATALTSSNAPIDLHNYEGVASVIYFATNVSGTSPKIYAYLEGSASGISNWYTLTNVSLASATTVLVTNIGLGSVLATNITLIPGTLTSTLPPALVPEPFTNNAVICSNTVGGVYCLGLVIPDQARYVHVATTVTGSNAIFVTGGVVISRKQSQTW